MYSKRRNKLSIVINCCLFLTLYFAAKINADETASPSESAGVTMGPQAFDFQCNDDVFALLGTSEMVAKLENHANSDIETFGDLGFEYDDGPVLDCENNEEGRDALQKEMANLVRDSLFEVGSGAIFKWFTSDEVDTFYVYSMDSDLLDSVLNGADINFASPFDVSGVYMHYDDNLNRAELFGLSVGLVFRVNKTTDVLTECENVVFGVFDAIITEMDRDYENMDADLVSSGDVGMRLNVFGSPLAFVEFNISAVKNINLANSSQASLFKFVNWAHMDIRIGNGIDDTGLEGSLPNIFAGVTVDGFQIINDSGEGDARFRFAVFSCQETGCSQNATHYMEDNPAFNLADVVPDFINPSTVARDMYSTNMSYSFITEFTDKSFLIFPGEDIPIGIGLMILDNRADPEQNMTNLATLTVGRQYQREFIDNMKLNTSTVFLNQYNLNKYEDIGMFMNMRKTRGEMSFFGTSTGISFQLDTINYTETPNKFIPTVSIFTVFSASDSEFKSGAFVEPNSLLFNSDQGKFAETMFLSPIFDPESGFLKIPQTMNVVTAPDYVLISAEEDVVTFFGNMTIFTVLGDGASLHFNMIVLPCWTFFDDSNLEQPSPPLHPHRENGLSDATVAALVIICIFGTMVVLIIVKIMFPANNGYSVVRTKEY